MTACGLDFGTSNTTLGTGGVGGARLLPLEGASVTLPSALFFDFETHSTAYGRAAIEAYVAGADGRLMRSIKSALGTDLIDADTQLDTRRISFRAVIAQFLGEVKRRGEAQAGGPLDAVVHGRPVHFVDGDADADAAAERALEEIARAVGFRHVSFQFEPIAAALDYEMQVDREELALIADIGGGTSDFSIVRIGPERRHRTDRAADILANDGVRIGGTDFDRDLSLSAVMPMLGFGSPMKRAGLLAPRSVYLDLATWSRINFLYTAKSVAELKRIHRESARPDLIGRLLDVVEEHRGHALAMDVERAKIALTGTPRTVLHLGWRDGGEEPAVTAEAMVEATASLAARIAARTEDCLRDAGVDETRVDAVFLTGGSTLLPHVRRAITGRLPGARVIEGDTFGSVGQGLAIEAGRRYGRR
ncbi:Hsp70 family protein [Azospirillum sp. RWY-5-1]|uniref:Hsp70 family protein n=1 Tax=Azospirillum oleiclasticum TaxID=2735135 RepID=A0ABX2T3X4_9PROT|nr:Hsp70 family protein [Azospirillum oleiclasticum]NYZ11862.1 Hsp70 family protein [Azospirillum oleiclasticum]NYZ19022.1 Hsp70 family protein [Azospirillum oleiclasticum]